MNNIEIQKGIIDSLYLELDNLDAPSLGKRISAMMDEQPQLMGFVFNLDDEFTEDEHTELLKSTIVIRDVFISAGIPLDVIYNESVEQVVGDRVKLYENFESEEVNNKSSWKEHAFSPELHQLIYNKVTRKGKSSQELSLIIDVIIGLFEEAAASQKNKENRNA